MDIARLRSATAADHDAVESSMPLMDPQLDLATYTAVLLQLRGLVSIWESTLRAEAPRALQPLTAARSRLHLLDQDLISLGKDPQAAPVASLPGFDTSAHLYGAMYVMEGSRLGGQFIARHIVTLFPGHHVTHYFQGLGNQTGPMWKELLQLIKDQVPDSDTDHAIAGAKSMFSIFGDWMRQTPLASPFTPLRRTNGTV